MVDDEHEVDTFPGDIDTQAAGSAEKINSTKSRLWSKSFILLWQGSLVSQTGNTIHTIAMSFWLLQKTGSTAIMGSITSLAIFVHSFVSLFSGAVVDKTNKKNVMAVSDFFQGIISVLLGLAAYFNMLDLWMVIILGILGGICSAFFMPASSSILPEIVPGEQLMRANAFMIMIVLGAPIFGNGAGGYLFQTFGAPLLFIGNGISFFISGFSEIFITIPKKSISHTESNLLNDIKEGYGYLLGLKGLFYFLIASMASNIFSFTGLFLILPFFERKAHLGAGAFGIAMAVMSAGGFIGMLLSTLFTIKPCQRFTVYSFCLLGMTILPVFIPFLPTLFLLCVLGFFAGFMRAYCFLIFNVVIQSNVAGHMMGRVNGILGIMLHTATPIGMLIGGILAEFFSLDLLISGSFAVSGLVILPILFYKPSRDMFKKEIEYSE